MRTRIEKVSLAGRVVLKGAYQSITTQAICISDVAESVDVLAFRASGSLGPTTRPYRQGIGRRLLSPALLPCGVFLLMFKCRSWRSPRRKGHRELRRGSRSDFSGENDNSLKVSGPWLSRWVGLGVSPLFGRPYDRCGDTGGN